MGWEIAVLILYIFAGLNGKLRAPAVFATGKYFPVGSGFLTAANCVNSGCLDDFLKR
jgi:hypothetical protein